MASLEDGKEREVQVRSSGRAALQALGVPGCPTGELVAARDKEKSKGSISSEAETKLSCQGVFSFHFLLPREQTAGELPSPGCGLGLPRPESPKTGWDRVPAKLLGGPRERRDTQWHTHLPVWGASPCRCTDV